jgi:sec-independent protein translocase protein TatC
MLAHWLALRRCLLRSLGCFLICFMASFYFSERLLHAILTPLLNALPYKGSLVLTKIGASFFLPVEIAAQVALLIALPYGLLEIWQFALPGLYTQERQKGWFFLIGSFILFILGANFCFWLILPWLFHFLVHNTPTDLHLMLDASDAIDMMLYMMMTFGLCFQLPLICIFLESMHWVTLAQLKRARRYVIVGAFVIGMILAPPDVTSQTLIALPLCLLFEVGLLSITLKENFKSVAFSRESK